MENYLGLLRDILENGEEKPDRTGIGSISVFGRTLRWNLNCGFPIVTTRKVPLRIAFEETMFFLRGERDTKKLEEKNIFIWQGNTTREFLDRRGLTYLKEGDMGYGYSHQWRNFGGVDGEIHQSTIMTDFHGTPCSPFVIPPTPGVDQIKNLVDGIKKDPYSRRHLVTAWNPQQVDMTPLPPCHILHQYQVTPSGKLNSCFIMRSNDVYHGLPFNIMSYAFLNMAFAKLLGYTPGELVYFGGDVHVYNHQLEAIKMQLGRSPRPLPKLEITKELSTLDDLLSLEFSDIKLTDYEPHPALPKIEMAV